MAKVAIKYENIMPYEVFFTSFKQASLDWLIDMRLGSRGLCSYSYSDIFRILFYRYHIEDVSTYLGDMLRPQPGESMLNSDTLARWL